MIWCSVNLTKQSIGCDAMRWVLIVVPQELRWLMSREANDFVFGLFFVLVIGRREEVVSILDDRFRLAPRWMHRWV